MSLLNAGLETLVLSFEVESLLLIEVAVADDGAEGEDGFCSVQAPPAAADVEAVGNDSLN